VKGLFFQSDPFSLNDVAGFFAACVVYLSVFFIQIFKPSFFLQ